MKTSVACPNCGQFNEFTEPLVFELNQPCTGCGVRLRYTGSGNVEAVPRIECRQLQAGDDPPTERPSTVQLGLLRGDAFVKAVDATLKAAEAAGLHLVPTTLRSPATPASERLDAKDVVGWLPKQVVKDGFWSYIKAEFRSTPVVQQPEQPPADYPQLGHAFNGSPLPPDWEEMPTEGVPYPQVQQEIEAYMTGLRRYLSLPDVALDPPADDCPEPVIVKAET